MNDKLDLLEKLRSYKTLTIIIAVVIVFELSMLFWMIPVKTTYIWVSLGGLALFFVYLVILCFRLIREMRDLLEK